MGAIHMITSDLIPDPASRHLRIFAFDPEPVGAIRHRRDQRDHDRDPVGEGPAARPGRRVHRGRRRRPGERRLLQAGRPERPARLLAQDGLAPSEANPQFHQQMVYAVAMTTIGHFEQALGRVALWSSHRREWRTRSSSSGGCASTRTRCATATPTTARTRRRCCSATSRSSIKDAEQHARARWSSPACRTTSSPTRRRTRCSTACTRASTSRSIRTCWRSTRRSPTSSRCSSTSPIRACCATRSRARAATSPARTCSAQLAQQFGKAVGPREGAARCAGRTSIPAPASGSRTTPDVHALDKHRPSRTTAARSSSRRCSARSSRSTARGPLDLYRIASEGTGVLRAGDIHPDLANRLADEAARCRAVRSCRCASARSTTARRSGLTFGDYLRAHRHRGHEFDPDDPHGYRLAFVESFRQWGIHPEGMRSMSVESLLWPTGEMVEEEAGVRLDRRRDASRCSRKTSAIDVPEQQSRRCGRLARMIVDKEVRLEALGPARAIGIRHGGTSTTNAAVLWGWLMKGKPAARARAFGLVLDEDDPPPTVFRSRSKRQRRGRGPLRATAVRRGPRGATVTDLVVEITQRRRGYFDPEEQSGEGRAQSCRVRRRRRATSVPRGLHAADRPEDDGGAARHPHAGTIADDDATRARPAVPHRGRASRPTPSPALATRCVRASRSRCCTAMARHDHGEEGREIEEREIQEDDGEEIRACRGGGRGAGGKADPARRRRHRAHVPHRPRRLLPAGFSRRAGQAGLRPDRLRLQAGLAAKYQRPDDRQGDHARHPRRRPAVISTSPSSPTSTRTTSTASRRRISTASRSARPGSPGPRTRRTTIANEPAQEVQGQAARAARRPQPPGGGRRRRAAERIDEFLAFELGGEDEDDFDAAAATALLGAAGGAGELDEQEVDEAVQGPAPRNGVRYLRPHEGILTLPGAEDVRVFALGPPRDLKQL